MIIDVIGWLSGEPCPMFQTRRLAAREGKKADDETMASSLDPTTVADPFATQTLTPVMRTQLWTS
jgi:hypothetical protein